MDNRDIELEYNLNFLAARLTAKQQRVGGTASTIRGPVCHIHQYAAPTCSLHICKVVPVSCSVTVKKVETFNNSGLDQIISSKMNLLNLNCSYFVQAQQA
jgi:hypothetical protein